jgi:hypothetical protein
VFHSERGTSYLGSRLPSPSTAALPNSQLRPLYAACDYRGTRLLLRASTGAREHRGARLVLRAQRTTATMLVVKHGRADKDGPIWTRRDFLKANEKKIVSHREDEEVPLANMSTRYLK